MDTKFWAVVCCMLMVIATLLEFLTPTLGGFTVAALLMAGMSVYLGFISQTPSFGYFMIALDLALFPITLWIGAHFLKRGPLMHRVEVNFGSKSAPDAFGLQHLLGQHGRALTPLRPSGSALIGESKVDVVTEGKFVEPNTPIVVIQIDGARVVVEPAPADNP